MLENYPEIYKQLELSELPAHHQLVDSLGLICPEPLMMLHQALRKSNSGETILLLATDPSTQRDITKLSNHLGHPLTHQIQLDETWLFWLTKK